MNITKARSATGAVVTSGYFTARQIETIKDVICKGASNNELQLFLYQCERTKLDPFSRQIYWIRRRDGSATILTSIDGFRVVAERSGQYAGQLGPEWIGETSDWADVWMFDTPPLAARVGVMRKDFKEPIWSTARFASYAVKRADGQPMGNWAKMPDLMIAKCAEALALRRAFPQDLSGLYTSDEMETIVPTNNENLHPIPPPVEQEEAADAEETKAQ